MSKTLRVAIVGTGPAGLYALGHLLEESRVAVEVDLFERLPTPWGLMRAGVAPDHPEKKLVIDRQFGFFLNDRRVRFVGNVDIGKDIGAAELSQWYDAVIYASGADGDNRMGIPHEALAGCWSAREFVAFYNGHPDYADLDFDLSCQRAVVVGNGNVALDVARILTMPVTKLEQTDIADHALARLRRSNIREVVILGRRGCLHGAFHTPELEEFEHIEDVDVVVEGEELPPAHDPALCDADRDTRRKIATLRHLAARVPRLGNRRVVFRFLASPVELLGAGKVERLRVVRNHLDRDERGNLQVRPGNQTSVIETGLVLRATGYRGTPFPELPFDERLGVIANRQGRVADNDIVLPGVYVTGWIKRGCRGIIGSNKKCARETVDSLLDDLDAGRLAGAVLDKDAVTAAIAHRKPGIVPRAGWLAIDRAEREAGRMQQRPRLKMTDTAAMLAHAAGR